MDKEGAMAVTYKEDDSRSGKRAAIYHGMAERVGHGISENPDDKRFIDPLALLGTEARSLFKKEQDKLQSLDKLSLRRQMGLNEETYTNMMVNCNLFNLRANDISVYSAKDS